MWGWPFLVWNRLSPLTFSLALVTRGGRQLGSSACAFSAVLGQRVQVDGIFHSNLEPVCFALRSKADLQEKYGGVLAFLKSLQGTAINNCTGHHLCNAGALLITTTSLFRS